MARSHTHGCPKCGTITAHHCTGRDAGAPDCPPVCEYEVDLPALSRLCEDCYEEAMDELAEEQRIEAEANKVDRLYEEWQALGELDATAAVLVMLKGQR